jgi:hypothetical protein
VALTTPRPADAHVSVSIGVPGFGVYVEGPPVYVPPPPVCYAPPVYYRSYYERPVYGRPYCDHERHRGWYKHDDEDDD